MLSPIFKKFVEKSPISVMARGMMERVLNPKQLDQWFDETAEQQYTKELMFSTVFDLMSQVVCENRKSVHAAYQASTEDIGVSITSLYNKLNGIETSISAELVRYTAQQVEPIIKKLGGTMRSPLPGLRIKLLDGNCIEKSQHRIKELRSISSGPLPGKSLVVYDPVSRLPIDVFPCEDGHAQERSLLKTVLLTIERADVWIADRNFCIISFTCGIENRGAFFAIREHKNYPLQLLGKEKYIGKIETGKVYEQLVSVVDDAGQEYTFRRIRIRLKKETRDGDTDIFIISNLSKAKANAKKIARLYRGRWTIETAFQHLAEHLNSEINTLGYPRAALFGFCVALVAYIIMSVVKSALGNVHGVDVIENQVSGYYVADEISATYRGMMIAIEDEHWVIFQQMTPLKLARVLKELAANVRLSAFRKHPRGPKKPQPKRKSCKNTPHVSTAKILAQRTK
ncbi:MAG: IS4 family transposase [Thermodesulfobacteriota bacterium]|nr:IS4 family transposase [Thermodesulfobacteriota bacterium]